MIFSKYPMGEMNKTRFGGGKSLPAKFRAPPDPLQEEKGKKELEPRGDWKEAKVLEYLEKKIQEMGIPEEDLEKKKQVFQKLIWQMEGEKWPEEFDKKAKREFIIEFVNWMLGKSQKNLDLKTTPWGKARLVGRGISEYIEELVGKKTNYELAIQKLRCFIPDDIDTAWLYFKFIVMKVPKLETQTQLANGGRIDPDDYDWDFYPELDWWLKINQGWKPGGPDYKKDELPPRFQVDNGVGFSEDSYVNRTGGYWDPSQDKFRKKNGVYEDKKALEKPSPYEDSAPRGDRGPDLEFEPPPGPDGVFPQKNQEELTDDDILGNSSSSSSSSSSSGPEYRPPSPQKPEKRDRGRPRKDEGKKKGGGKDDDDDGGGGPGGQGRKRANVENDLSDYRGKRPDSLPSVAGLTHDEYQKSHSEAIKGLEAEKLNLLHQQRTLHEDYSKRLDHLMRVHDELQKSRIGDQFQMQNFVVGMTERYKSEFQKEIEKVRMSYEKPVPMEIETRSQEPPPKKEGQEQELHQGGGGKPPGPPPSQGILKEKEKADPIAQKPSELEEATRTFQAGGAAQRESELESLRSASRAQEMSLADISGTRQVFENETETARRLADNVAHEISVANRVSEQMRKYIDELIDKGGFRDPLLTELVEDAKAVKAREDALKKELSLLTAKEEANTHKIKLLDAKASTIYNEISEVHDQLSEYIKKKDRSMKSGTQYRERISDLDRTIEELKKREIELTGNTNFQKELMGQTIRELEEKLRVTETHSKNILDIKDQTIKEKEEKVQELNRVIADKTGTIEELTKRLHWLTEEKNSLSAEKTTESAKYESEITALRLSIDTEKNNLELAKKAKDQFDKQLSSVKSQLRSIEDEREMLRNKLTQAQTEYNFLKNEASVRVDSLEKEISDNDSEKQRLGQVISEQTRRIEALESDASDSLRKEKEFAKKIHSWVYAIQKLFAKHGLENPIGSVMDTSDTSENGDEVFEQMRKKGEGEIDEFEAKMLEIYDRLKVLQEKIKKGDSEPEALVQEYSDLVQKSDDLHEERARREIYDRHRTDPSFQFSSLPLSTIPENDATDEIIKQRKGEKQTSSTYLKKIDSAARKVKASSPQNIAKAAAALMKIMRDLAPSAHSLLRTMVTDDEKRKRVEMDAAKSVMRDIAGKGLSHFSTSIPGQKEFLVKKWEGMIGQAYQREKEASEDSDGDATEPFGSDAEKIALERMSKKRKK